VTAGSDLLVRIPTDGGLRFTFHVGGEVDSRVAGLNTTEEGGAVTGSFGAAENPAILEASVGSDVALRPAELDGSSYGDFGVTVGVLEGLKGLEQIGDLVTARVAEAMSELELHLEEGLRSINSDRIRAQVEREVARAQQIAEQAAEHAAQQMQHAAERVRQAAEREAERAQREAERARREAEREAERARLRAEGAERRWQRASGRPEPEPAPAPEPAPRPEPAADQRAERLRILQMVEEGKLSAGEAAELLGALR